MPSPNGSQSQFQPSLNQTIIAAFKGPIKPIPVQSSYLIGLVFATLVAVLIPLAYCATVIGLLYGLDSYFQYLKSGMSGAHGRGSILLFGPLIIGVVLLIFMCKPLIQFVVILAQGRDGRKVTKASEPLLFSFIEKICRTTGSTVPTEVLVDCQANASASFKGTLGLFTNDLVLTIGLPLVGGMNMRQFAGVLAHEFGHFSQPVAMRMTYIIRTVNLWLSIAVYGDEEKGDSGFDASDIARAHISAYLIYLAACLFVALTRFVLWCLLMLSHAVSSNLLRQMEYNADKYEAALAGGQAFEQTVKNLQIINVATHFAHDSAANDWQEGRLPNDLPALIGHKTQDVTPEIKSELKKMQLESKTEWDDSHPCDQDRVLAIRSNREPGVFTLEMPAAVLFQNFQTLSKVVTSDFYTGMLGRKFRPEMMRAVDEVIYKERSDDEGGVLAANFIQAEVTLMRAIPFPAAEPKPPASYDAALQEVKSYRAKTLQDAPAYRAAAEELEGADMRAMNANIALELLAFNIKITAKNFDFPAFDKATVELIRDEAELTFRESRSIAESYETFSGQRLMTSLSLLWMPEVQSTLPIAKKLQDDVVRLLPHAQFLSELIPVINDGIDKFNFMLALYDHSQGQESNEAYRQRTKRSVDELFQALKVLQSRMGDRDDPFGPQNSSTKLRARVLQYLPNATQPDRVFQVAQDCFDGLYSTYARILCRLFTIAHDAEKALGLDPLPDISKVKKGSLSRLRDGEKGVTVQTNHPSESSTSTSVAPAPAKPRTASAAAIAAVGWDVPSTGTSLPPPPPPPNPDGRATFLIPRPVSAQRPVSATGVVPPPPPPPPGAGSSGVRNDSKIGTAVKAPSDKKPTKSNTALRF